ncbi:transketolase [Patescibacteria group bacterium]|nr:transketolase [Patescibacteria group bacterium]
MDQKQLDQLSINTIRFLAVDAVQKANSGHPGLPMGAAPMAYTLWTKFLSHNPNNPEWLNRDRFILSAGHGSMLLYSLLHLTGYDIPLSQIKRFRQWDSKTPGHPEYEIKSGIETTTGPLGQGFGNGIGMAIAQRYLSNRYNKRGFKLFDYYIYSIVSDGDLMEGVSSETASMAGNLKLGKLIYLYDDNDISIEGSTNITFTEDVATRFKAFEWHVQKVNDGNNIKAIEGAIEKAKKDNRPSIIIIKTTIGYGSPNKANTASAHGEALGEEEVELTKENLNWPKEPAFYIPKEALEHFRTAVEKGHKQEKEWNEMLKEYKKKYPTLAKALVTLKPQRLPVGWAKKLSEYSAKKDPVATRVVSGEVLNILAKFLPNLIGGSADLEPSNKTYLKGKGDFSAKTANRETHNLHFGVREHGMAAILNGIALSKLVIPYGGTFLIFSDYMRPSIRLAALMGLRVVYVFTHDSIGLGEDGPTHQPIEQLMALRAIPNMTVIRPADANETVQAWKVAIENTTGPTAICLTRQSLPIIDQKTYSSAKNLSKGAYILNPKVKNPDIILIATGSEVQLAMEASEKLSPKVNARVVSMPSWELFEKQPQSYKDKVLPPEVKSRLAIEAGVTQGWYKYVGDKGDIIGIDKFGASAPGKVVMKKYGFGLANVVKKAREIIKKNK